MEIREGDEKNRVNNEGFLIKYTNDNVENFSQLSICVAKMVLWLLSFYSFPLSFQPILCSFRDSLKSLFDFAFINRFSYEYHLGNMCSIELNQGTRDVVSIECHEYLGNQIENLKRKYIHINSKLEYEIGTYEFNKKLKISSQDTNCFDRMLYMSDKSKNEETIPYPCGINLSCSRVFTSISVNLLDQPCLSQKCYQNLGQLLCSFYDNGIQNEFVEDTLHTITLNDKNDNKYSCKSLLDESIWQHRINNTYAECGNYGAYRNVDHYDNISFTKESSSLNFPVTSNMGIDLKTFAKCDDFRNKIDEFESKIGYDDDFDYDDDESNVADEVSSCVENNYEKLNNLMDQQLTDIMIRKIEYSNRYSDGKNEYRWVMLPRSHPFLMLDPSDEIRNQKFSENQIRKLGIRQSKGWNHIGYSPNEPHVLLFKREITNVRQTAFKKCAFRRNSRSLKNSQDFNKDLISSSTSAHLWPFHIGFITTQCEKNVFSKYSGDQSESLFSWTPSLPTWDTYLSPILDTNNCLEIHHFLHNIYDLPYWIIVGMNVQVSVAPQQTLLGEIVKIFFKNSSTKDFRGPFLNSTSIMNKEAIIFISVRLGEHNFSGKKRILPISAISPLHPDASHASNPTTNVIVLDSSNNFNGEVGTIGGYDGLRNEFLVELNDGCPLLAPQHVLYLYSVQEVD